MQQRVLGVGKRALLAEHDRGLDRRALLGVDGFQVAGGHHPPVEDL